MKWVKKLCSVILTVMLILSSAAVVSAAENYIVLYGFAFDINADGKAVIHSYDDRSADVSVPQKLMGADVVSIDDYAFFNDTAIISVSLGNATSLKTIGINAFYGCSELVSLAIPEWLESLSFGTFQDCSSLSELSIANGIAQIPDQCFYGCTDLKQVSLPESITAIGERAFMNCSALSAVEIPDTVEYIAEHAFEGCPDLVIYCTKDSYALSYASDYHIAYVVTDADPEPGPITYIIGDADSDGEVTIFDATTIQRAVAKMIVEEGYNADAANVDRDEGVTIFDATHIQRYLARFYDPYHIDEIVSYAVDDGAELNPEL